jgi:hypothetical protein
MVVPVCAFVFARSALRAARPSYQKALFSRRKAHAPRTNYSRPARRVALWSEIWQEARDCERS